jgi:hypothetical protein
MKSMRISDYLEFKYPTYTYLKVVPSTSIRNYDSGKIVNLVASLYKSIKDNVHLVEKKLFFESNAKVSFYIYMEKTTVDFYFIVPEKHYSMFKEKIIDVWNNRVTITSVPNIPNFNQDCTKYFLTYKKEDALSLSCDKRNNVLLGSMLNTLHVMEDGDRIGVFYNFNPIYQKTWRSSYDNTINKLKDDMPINKNKMDAIFILRTLLVYALDFIDIILGRKKEHKTNTELMLSSDTTRKRDSIVVETQVLCLSESQSKQRERDNALACCSSFKSLDGDNELVYRKYTGKFEAEKYRLQRCDSIKVQPREAQNFISIPGKEILEEHKIIDHTDVLESPVPGKLQQGYICLGKCVYKGSEVNAYLRDTYDQGNFPLVAIGEQGAGKTTYIANYVNDIQSRHEGCMVIDYIKNCELASTIEKVVPKDSLIVLDMSDINSIQGIGYNELKPKGNSLMDWLDMSNRKSLYISMLIDALNTDGDPLSSSMDRFLNAASNIVMLNQNASLKDVVRCLNDHMVRRKYIDSINDVAKAYLDEEIAALVELDEIDKKTGEVVGTKNSKVDGVNHRINLLRKDFRLKTMFNKPCTDNIDLVSAMEDGKVILIKMPQEYFATPYSKNVIVTYLFTKIWSAMLVRGGMNSKPKRFHVIVDEIFQCKTAMQLLRDQEILPQTRKFGCKFVFSCQYLGQINTIDQTLRSAGASYMLMKGSGRANFDEFKDELSPYTLDDMEALPQYSCLNLINYEDGRAKFVTRLPKPL